MKTVKQIDLSLENRPGVLSAVSDTLGVNGINIIGFHVVTDVAEGTVRVIVNDPEKAINVLKTAGYGIDVKEVIGCEIPHHPGGLNAILKPLKEADINVDYLYPCMSTGSSAVLILGVSPVEKTLKVLEENWIRVLGDELYHM